MKETQKYLVPDYFPEFSCKMGACRAACCVGWPVSITMDDYFRLLGMECSPELRRRLDVALHICEHPTPDEYAQILPRWDGDCQLRMEDGRCMLHAELGESALSHVCALYPRGVRCDSEPECSCANSCERVVEMLMERREPIAFTPMELAFDLPAQPDQRSIFYTAGRGQDIRMHFIRILQKRVYPLPLRLMQLSGDLAKMDAALTAKDPAWVDRILAEDVCRPDLPEKMPDWAHLKAGLEAAERMVDMFDRGSRSICDYGEAALKYFGEGEAAFGRYAIARAHFDELLPNWEIYFENLLVNHMFFARFPFQDRPVSLKDEFIALCAVYSLLRFLSIGWLADKSSPDDFVDVAAAAFRLIDHTSFDRYSIQALAALGLNEKERLYELILL